VYVVVRPLSERGQGGIVRVGRAQHDDEGIPAIGAEAAQKAEAIHAGELHVIENQLEIFGSRTGERTRGVALGLDQVAGLSEQQRERLPDIGVFLNDQQPHQFTRGW
jgi:hypothetical protein